MKLAAKIVVILTALGCLYAPCASALTVVTSFMGGSPPANAAGGGDLIQIVNTAARIWETCYSDPVTITLYFGWAPVGDAGTHTLLMQGGIPNREVAGIILFDNSGAASFYLDPTPDANEEYQRRSEEYQDLGGGGINVARIYYSPRGLAAGRVDLLSVALHEIGHALGMCAANVAFMAEAQKGALSIRGDYAYAGTLIPLATNHAGITSHFDALKVSYGALMAGIGSDERRLPSTLDILADAQVSGFTIAASDTSRLQPARIAARAAIASHERRR